MPYPISDIVSNFALYNEVYPRGTVLHDKTNNAIRVADGITAYNDLPIIKGRVELVPVNANLVYCGPPSGAVPAVPTFRALVAADLGSGAGTATNVLQDNGDGTTSWVAAPLSVTPAALTKSDDTNVTLTLGGSPSTALVNAASIAVGWTGQLAVSRGGTGLGTLGSANQLIRVNAGGTALEYFTPTYGSGTVTSVAALTLGTAGTDLSSTVANGTTTPVITLNVPTASATNRGVLSAADWTTFNNKGNGTVTSIATAGLISGGTITSSGTITTSMSTNKLVGRGTAGTGVMEEITLGTGLSLTGTTLNVTGSGITIGTTPITSGTVGRLLFEGTGNVVSESANIFWDNPNSRLSLAMGNAPGARLDVLGVGTASTDISLRLRNSANTANLFLAVGSTQFIFGQATTTPSGMVLMRHNYGAATDILTIQQGTYSNTLFRVRDENTAVTGTMGSIYFGGRIYNQTAQTTQQFDLGGFGLGASYGDNLNNIVLLSNVGNVGDGTGSIVVSTSSNFYVNSQTTKKYKFEANKGNLGIAQMSFGTNGTNVLAIATGVAPTTSPADCYQTYSSDIVAGNAAPHFRTENGDVVRLYSVGGWALPTGSLTRTTFDTTTVTTQQLAERVAALITDFYSGQQLIKA